jgi:hypothetical protein
MRRLRLFLAPLVACALVAQSCGTSAIGVDDCRSIESARCQAARGCSLGLDSEADQGVCLRFARDNCLHGLAVQAPTAGSVTECVHALNAAGSCVTNKTPLGSCTAVGQVTQKATVCDLIENPENIPACEFLTQTPAPAPTATAPKDSGAG